MSILQQFLFPPPPSPYITAMSVIGFASVSYCGLSEVRGIHLQYSKFWNVQIKGRGGKEGIKLSSRAGMLLLYAPAFLAGAASLAFFPASPSLRFSLLSWALTIHFLKRVLEVSEDYYFYMVSHSSCLCPNCFPTSSVHCVSVWLLCPGSV